MQGHGDAVARTQLMPGGPKMPPVRKEGQDMTGNSGKPAKKPECLPGIQCDVTNCTYHEPNGKCHAESIQVGPTHASACRDTQCATFEQQDTSGKAF